MIAILLVILILILILIILVMFITPAVIIVITGLRRGGGYCRLRYGRLESLELLRIARHGAACPVSIRG